MKKSYLLSLFVLVLVTMSSCSKKDKDKVDLKVDDVEISGENSDLISVVPGTYSIVKTTSGLSIKVKFKLEQTIENADSIETYEENGGGLNLDNLKLVCTDENGMSIDEAEFDLGEGVLDVDTKKSFEKFLTSSVGTEKEFVFSLSASKDSDPYKNVMSKAKGFKITGMDATVEPGYSSVSSDDSSAEDPSTDDETTSDESTESSTDGEAISNVDAALDEYERYVNKYIKLVKKASNGDPTAVAEYADMLQSAQSLQEKLDNAKGDFTSAQMSRLARIENKLINAANAAQ